MSFKVVGIGEVLWDLLPGGKQLGGAPANFAYHAHGLGAAASVVSRVGKDALGQELLGRLSQLGLGTGTVEEDPALPTGTVTVELGADGQPHYTIHENVAWDYIAGEAAGKQAAAVADAVCFGSLAQRSEVSRRSIRVLLSAAPARSLRIFDMNLRQSYYARALLEESLALANVLKVNDTELATVAEMFDLAHGERLGERACMVELAGHFDLRTVACTRGEKGSLVYSEGRWSECPGQPVKVADTVGAGDAFAAALALGLLAGWPLEEIHRRAADVAAYVCTQAGATPELPADLRAPFLAVR